MSPTDGMELKPLNHSLVLMFNIIYQIFVVYLLCASWCARSNCVICHFVWTYVWTNLKVIIARSGYCVSEPDKVQKAFLPISHLTQQCVEVGTIIFSHLQMGELKFR